MQTLTKPKIVTKQDFVAALRSGKYNQLQNGRLKDDDNNVCTVMVWHILNGDSDLNVDTGSNSVFGMPTAVYNQLASLNDSGYTFSEMADLIDSFMTDDLKIYGN